jgi:thioredoxin reductase
MYDFVIIGFGISGISFSKYAVMNNFKILIIEKSNLFGGIWNSALNTTELQTHKKYYQYDDFPMPSNYPIHPNKLQILKYLENVINFYKLDNHVKYNHKMINSIFTNGSYNCEILNIITNQIITIKSKYLIICNGYYNSPKYINTNNFSNKIINITNINDYNLNIFKNKNVCIIGNGSSSCDLLKEMNNLPNKLYVIYKHDKFFIKKIVCNISTALILNKYLLKIFKNLPIKLYLLLFKIVNIILFNNYLNVPYSIVNSKNLIGSNIIPSLINKNKLIYIKDTIINFNKNNIILENNILYNIDYLILCNGYKENYDFINNKFKYYNRYKQIINPYIDNCAFIGLSPSYNWLQNSYNQSIWYIDNIVKHNKIIDKFTMLNSIENIKKEKSLYNLDYNDLTYELFTNY